MKVSRGASKELLVVQFVHSLLSVAKVDEVKEDDNLVERDSNKDYRVNKRIDRNLAKLQDELQEIITAFYNRGGIELATWVKANLNKRIGNTLTKLQDETLNLEMLSMWILYANFCDRSGKLDEGFKSLTNAEQYFKVTELMGGTKIGYLEEPLYLEAYEIIKMIKG